MIMNKYKNFRADPVAGNIILFVPEIVLVGRMLRTVAWCNANCLKSSKNIENDDVNNHQQ